MAHDDNPKAPKRLKSPGSDNPNTPSKKPRHTGTKNPFTDRGPDRVYHDPAQGNQDNAPQFDSRYRNSNATSSRRSSNLLVPSPTSDDVAGNRKFSEESLGKPDRTAPLSVTNNHQATSPSDASPLNSLQYPPTVNNGRPAIQPRAISNDSILHSSRHQLTTQESGAPLVSGQPTQPPRISSSVIGPENSTTLDFMNTYTSLLLENTSKIQQHELLVLRNQAAVQEHTQNSVLFKDFPALRMSKSSARGRVEQAMKDVHEEQDQLRAKLDLHVQQHASMLDGHAAKDSEDQKIQISEQNNQIKEQNDQISAQKQELESQRAELRNLQARLDSAGKTISKLSGLEGELSSIRSRIDRVDQNSKATYKDVGDLQAHVKQLQKESKDFKQFQGDFGFSDLDKMWRWGKTTGKEVDILGESLEKLRKEVTTTKDGKKVDSLEKDVNIVKEGLQRLRKEVKTNKDGELEKLRDDITELPRGLDKLQEDVSRRLLGMEQQIESFKSVVDQRAETSGSDSNEVVAEYANCIKDLNRRLEKVESQSAGVDVRGGKSKDHERTINQTVNLVSGRLDGLESVIRRSDFSLPADVTQLKEKVATGEQNMANLTQTSGEHKNEIEKLKASRSSRSHMSPVTDGQDPLPGNVAVASSDSATSQHMQRLTENLRSEIDGRFKERFGDFEQNSMKNIQSTCDEYIQQVRERCTSVEQLVIKLGGASSSSDSQIKQLSNSLNELKQIQQTTSDSHARYANHLNSRINECCKSIDPVRIATQNLEMRYQNLTTESHLRLIVNEVSRMFPDARHLQQAMEYLHPQVLKIKDLSATVEALQQAKDVHVHFFQSYGPKLEELTKAHNSLLQRVERDYEGMVKKIDDLKDTPGLLADHTQSLTELRKNLQEYKDFVQKVQLQMRVIEGQHEVHKKRIAQVAAAVHVLNEQNGMPGLEEES